MLLSGTALRMWKLFGALCLLVSLAGGQNSTSQNTTTPSQPDTTPYPIEDLTPQEVALRLFIALILGCGIGIEREFSSRKKDVYGIAGVRTHMLVCLVSRILFLPLFPMCSLLLFLFFSQGSCLIQMISVYGYGRECPIVVSREVSSPFVAFCSIHRGSLLDSRPCTPFGSG